MVDAAPATRLDERLSPLATRTELGRISGTTGPRTIYRDLATTFFGTVRRTGRSCDRPYNRALLLMMLGDCSEEAPCCYWFPVISQCCNN
jgi:hypothetical protein